MSLYLYSSVILVVLPKIVKMTGEELWRIPMEEVRLNLDPGIFSKKFLPFMENKLVFTLSSLSSKWSLIIFHLRGIHFTCL